MTSRSSIILSFFLATLLAVGSVELFYRSFSKAMIEDKEVTQVQTEKMPEPNFSSPTSLQTSQRKSAKRKEDYTIISKRNLFGKVQKTSKQIVKPQPVLTTTSLDLTLLGTIGGSENDQRAIIRDKKKNTQDIYYKGDAIANALIKEIRRGKIILTLNGKDEILLMEESKSPPGTANNQSLSIPEVFTPPTRRIPDDDIEMEGDEPSDDIPPPTTPKRRMTLKPKKHR